VVLTARDVSSIEPLAAVVPEQALALALDITNEDQIHAALDAAIERFGPLDVVVNDLTLRGKKLGRLEMDAVKPHSCQCWPRVAPEQT